MENFVLAVCVFVSVDGSAERKTAKLGQGEREARRYKKKSGKKIEGTET